jgi:MFS family permease
VTAQTADITGELGATGRAVETMIPRRLDRLPWSHWHWIVVLALGITWILDGFEVTLVGAVAAKWTDPGTLHLTTSQSSLAGVAYLSGAVAGALFFGYLTDRLGRKVLFMVTLGVYLLFTVCTAFSWDIYSLFVFRVLAGAGIGGEYAAINSAIDELIPARVRGRVALAINGSWWVGTAIAAAISYPLLKDLSSNVGWRIGFAVGAILAICIIFLRRGVPESPRWLLTHGRADEAESVVCEIEERVRRQKGELPEPEGEPLAVEQRQHIGFGAIASYVVRNYPKRGVLGISLMIGQAFLYNAVFFTYTLVLNKMFGVSEDIAGLYLIPFAIGNVLGVYLLGPLFDSLGRRIMISFTYVTSGVLLIVTGLLFTHHVVGAGLMTVCWSVIFFFASAGASAAYLTVSELFPMEARAMAIALFYAVGTGCAIGAPYLFGWLIASGDRNHVFYGYLLGAVLMIGAGVVAWFLAVSAERRSLEDIAKPLTARRGSGPQRPATVGARAR